MKSTKAFSGPFYFVASFVGLTFTAGLLFRFSPYYHHVDFRLLGAWLRGCQGHWWTLPAIMAAYMMAGLILFMHVILLWTTVLTFDPWHSMLYCEVGSMASAIFVYGLGRVLRPELARRLAGSSFDRVSQALARRGKLTLMFLHWFPLCPFSMLNFLSGSTHIRFRDFVIGTFVGATPGIIFISFFGGEVRSALNHPHWQAFAVLGLVLVLGGGIFFWGRWRLKRAIASSPLPR